MRSHTLLMRAHTDIHAYTSMRAYTPHTNTNTHMHTNAYKIHLLQLPHPTLKSIRQL